MKIGTKNIPNSRLITTVLLDGLTPVATAAAALAAAGAAFGFWAFVAMSVGAIVNATRAVRNLAYPGE